MIGLEEKDFKAKDLRWLENAFLTLFLHIQKILSMRSFNSSTSTILPLTLQKVPNSADIMTELYLSFLKLSNVCLLRPA